MLRYVDSPLFESPARVLVNAVNTVGVMGKGVALEFKTRYPEMYRLYRDHCNAGRFQVGQLWLYRTLGRWVLNFPTKVHWRSPSKTEYIRTGLEKFVATYQDRGIDSIAFPLLGCGNGRLNFETQVRPMMEQYLRSLPIPVYIHRRRESPDFVAEHEELDLFSSMRLPGSFHELWDHLLQLKEDDLELQTFKTESPFRLTDVTDTNLVFDRLHGARVHIPAEDIRSLWHRLNNTGTVLSREAPGRIGREYSLVFPLLAELPYVSRVTLSEDYDDFVRRQTQGLQLRFRDNLETSTPIELASPVG